MTAPQYTFLCRMCKNQKLRESFGDVVRTNGEIRRHESCRECVAALMPVVLPDEHWRPVVGYEGWYEVSDLGRVRRVRPANGTTVGMGIKTIPSSRGYLCVGLRRDGRLKRHLVHRLVAAAFLGPCPEGQEVNHKDADKANATLSNLEYVTPLENARHAAELGLLNPPHGVTHYKAKLREEDIPAIREAQGSLSAIGRRYGVHAAVIQAVKRGRTWKHVPLIEGEG